MTSSAYSKSPPTGRPLAKRDTLISSGLISRVKYVADAEGMKRVAARIVASKRDGNKVVVVVSAMGDTTDELIDLANQITPIPTGRELDISLFEMPDVS